MKSFSIKQKNSLLNFITQKNSANSNSPHNNLIEAENLLKGYVNNLVKQTVLGFDVEERRNLIMKKAKNKNNYSGSSSNLRVKRKRGIMKKKEKEEINKYNRRMSYNVDIKSRVNFNINENEKKNEKNNEKKNEKKVEIKIENSNSSDDNLEQTESTRRQFKRKKNNFKTMRVEKVFEEAKLSPKRKERLSNLPKYKTSHNSSNINIVNSMKSLKGSLDIDEQNKKKTNKEELFSLLKVPQKFDGENDNSDSLGLSLEDQSLLQFSGLSNKNILQLNEIQKELKKTLIGKKTIIKKTLSCKSFNDDDHILNQEKKSRIETHIDEVQKEKYRILTRKGYVYDSYDDEENLDERDIHNHLNPDSFIVIFIDFFVAICVLYNIIFIPLFLGKKDIYCSTGDYYNLENIIENFIDFVFLFDLFINFFIDYYNFDEVLVSDYKSIVKNYLNTWFFIDLICAIPIKTLFILFNKICYDEGFKTTPLYNGHYYYLLMLIRLLKIFQVISKNKFLAYIENKLSEYENFNSYGRLLISILIFFMSLHIVACIFIFIGKNEYPSWIINFNHQNKSFNQLYLVGIYNNNSNYCWLW